MWDPPNRGYRLDPKTGLPIPSQHDLGKLDPSVRCPKDGGVMVRIGSNDLYNCRCQQCGTTYGLAA